MAAAGCSVREEPRIGTRHRSLHVIFDFSCACAEFSYGRLTSLCPPLMIERIYRSAHHCTLYLSTMGWTCWVKARLSGVLWKIYRDLPAGYKYRARMSMPFPSPAVHSVSYRLRERASQSSAKRKCVYQMALRAVLWSSVYTSQFAKTSLMTFPLCLRVDPVPMSPR
jgi:hypothetical protein